MERLTKRLDDGRAITSFCTRYDDESHNECYVGHSVDRLAAYEDTDLTPTDISDLRNFACNLCGRYKTAHEGACDGCRWKKGE